MRPDLERPLLLRIQSRRILTPPNPRDIFIFPRIPISTLPKCLSGYDNITKCSVDMRGKCLCNNIKTRVSPMASSPIIHAKGKTKHPCKYTHKWTKPRYFYREHRIKTPCYVYSLIVHLQQKQRPKSASTTTNHPSPPRVKNLVLYAKMFKQKPNKLRNISLRK